jgi:hypothetical protein
MFNGIPKDRYLKEVRDFMAEPKDEADCETFLAVVEKGDIMTAFETCVLRYRLHLIKAATENLQSELVKTRHSDQC